VEQRAWPTTWPSFSIRRTRSRRMSGLSTCP
jgi:hypothetical protein